MKKNIWRFPLILGILFFMINAVAFALLLHKTMMFWVNDAAILIALLLVYLSVFIADKHGPNVKSRFLGWPIVRSAINTFILVFFIAVVISALNIFIAVPLRIPIVFYVLSIGICLISLITTDSTRDFVLGKEQNLKMKKSMMKELQQCCGNIVIKCSDKEIQKDLEVLQEEFRYSDPNSSDELFDIEKSVESELRKLESMLNTDKQACANQIKKVSELLRIRNQKCLHSKKNTYEES